jgi:ribonucleotide reductase beta subunit family protein with ferritin-like domain
LLLGEDGEHILCVLEAKDMRDFVEFNANTLCGLLGVELIYPKRANPLPWYDAISLLSKVNQFERANIYNRGFAPAAADAMTGELDC